MLNVFEYAQKLLLEQALATNRASFGLLLNPAQVADEARRRQRTLTPDTWHLCGNLHPEMFALARGASLQHLGKTYVSTTGATYLVLAQQVKSWQHRFVLQLVGVQMKEFVQAARDGSCELLLGHALEDEGLVMPGRDYLRRLLAEPYEVAQAPADLVSLAAETCAVAAQLLGPDAVTAEELPQVEYVCVTMVQSAEVQERTFEALRRKARKEESEKAG